MNNAWAVEFSRIFVLACFALVVGWLSGLWLLGFLLAAVAYIGWTLFQIKTFERWIRLGAKTQFAPDAGGIWQLIVRHIHRAQQKNAHRKDRLRDMAKRYEATITAIPDATVVLNVNLEIEWSNRAAFDLLGIDASKDYGQRIDNLIRHPSIQSIFEPRDDNKVNFIEMESPTDATKTLSISCVEFGELQKLIMARDISQRLAVQKMRKAFVANASHELRTPLTVISGYLEMLENEPGIADGVKKQLLNAKSQASRMQKILDDLLTLSKLEEKGHSKQSGETVDMPNLLIKLISDFRKIKAKGTHEIHTEIDKKLCLKATESDIYSLCQNLLSNAVKYSPHGSMIEVSWKNGGDYVCLSVKDNGEGIAPEHLSRLTERFYRVNVSRSRQVGGTGLGLSIVRHILENHGGFLEIDSQSGVGSTFTACFPKYRIIEHQRAERAD